MNPATYTCRSYLILGEWNLISDVNTVIDPGVDDFVINEIESISTGFGKVPVEQIILTHNHFDHAAGVEAMKRKYRAKVFGAVPSPWVDELLYEGQMLKAGDDYLEVMLTPGHSSDSICLYCQSKGLLFSGDTQLRVLGTDGIYTPEYVDSLERIARRKISVIYGGHDGPLEEHVREMLHASLENVRQSRVMSPEQAGDMANEEI